MGTVGGSGFQVSAEGVVRFADGAQADLTTLEGMARAEAVLDSEQVLELKALMRAQGFRFEGQVFVPDDTYGRARTGRTDGPTSTNEGKTDIDAELAAAFQKAGVPNPYNANTTKALLAKLKTDPGFGKIIELSNAMVTNPTPENEAAFVAGFTQFAGKNVGVNAMELLYLVFRESIQDVNEDKKYFLHKLQDYNKMAEALSKYLEELVQKSMELSEKGKGKEYPEKETVEVVDKTFDTGTLDVNGEMLYSTTGRDEKKVTMKGYKPQVETEHHDTRLLNRTALTDLMKRVENQQEEVRNKRQMATTAFQNFDQKSNQLMNMLATVIKTMNEMRGIGAASRSGL
jgi:hypothetical protein